MGALTEALVGTIRRSYRTAPLSPVSGTVAVSTNGRQRVGKPEAELFRNWAEHSDWVRAAVRFMKTQVSQSEWDIVPADRERRYDRGLAREVRNYFLSPTNPGDPDESGDSFRSWIEPIVEDVLVLDAGSIEKERTIGGDLHAFHGVDGGRVYVNRFWSGERDDARYWFKRGPADFVPFVNADLVYIMSNPRTYSPVGLSPLETLKWTIDQELASSAYNARQVTNAAPDGILDLGEGARGEQVEAFKSYWQAEVAGRGAMAFIGGTKGAKFLQFRGSNREMQFIEWNVYLVRKICAVFGLSTQDLNVTFDINRATGEVQADKTESAGVRPFLSLVQDYATRELVWDKAFRGRRNNLAFRFTRLSIKESLDKAQMNKLALAGVPWKVINEARADEGRLPLGDALDPANPFNMPMANTPLGIVRLDNVDSASDVAKKPVPAAPPARAGDQQQQPGGNE